MRVWWCNQSGQWHVERPNEVVCSNDSSANGGNIMYRKTVGDVKTGDLIVHITNRKTVGDVKTVEESYVVAFSRALEDGRYYNQLPLLNGEDYRAGWRFGTKYFDLKTPIPNKSFGKSLIPLRVTHYPINRNGSGCQGYCFPFDFRGLTVILSLVNEELPDWLNAHRSNHLLLPEEVVETPALWEGAVSRITVNAYERDPEARRRCIEHYGAKCVACGSVFGKQYGEVAEGMIHVHHLKPISEIGKSYVVDPIQDLRPVCPNCHAVIHLRSDPPYSIEDVRAFLGQATNRDDPGGRR